MADMVVLQGASEENQQATAWCEISEECCALYNGSSIIADPSNQPGGLRNWTEWGSWTYPYYPNYYPTNCTLNRQPLYLSALAWLRSLSYSLQVLLVV